MPTGIETNPVMHEPFPLDLFLYQYNRQIGYGLSREDVQCTTFRSRKHATVEINVFYRADEIEHNFNDTIIAKHFDSSSQDRKSLEHDVLVRASASGIAVPGVLEVLDNFLLLEKVEGETLMDSINGSIFLGQKTKIVTGIARWLASFHVAFASDPIARRRGDTNLRNFIVSPSGIITGIDFEEASIDDPINDLHEIVDSILQSDPGIYSVTLDEIGWKFDLCENLLVQYLQSMNGRAMILLESPETFVKGQVEVMKQLAYIRGKEVLLAETLPGIESQLLKRMEHAFSLV